MIPISDDKPAARFPFMVILIIILNCLVFWQELTVFPDIESFIRTHGMIPARDFATGLNLRPYFTSMFLHGGLAHLIMNLWALWIFGDNIEGVMGPARFTLFYLACGFAAALAHAAFHPSSDVPVVGASGAIAGVMGAYLILFPTARIKMFTLLVFYPVFFEIPAFVFLIIWFMGQIFSGAIAFEQARSTMSEPVGIAFFAHAGGFLAGIVLLPFFKKRKKRN